MRPRLAQESTCVRVGFSCAPATKIRIEQLAVEQGKSFSQLIRDLIEEVIVKYEHTKRIEPSAD
jgi:hypothetical protein